MLRRRGFSHSYKQRVCSISVKLLTIPFSYVVALLLCLPHQYKNASNRSLCLRNIGAFCTLLDPVPL